MRNSDRESWDGRFPQVAFLAGTLGLGGAERQLAYQVTALQQAGARPVVLSMTHGEEWEGRLRRLGVPVVCIGRRGSRSVRLARLIEALQSVRPDVIQSAHFFTNMYAVAAGRIMGIPDIGAVRNDAKWSVSSLGHLGRASLHRPSVLAVNSEQAARQSIAMGVPCGRVCVVPNVVDVSRFAVDRSPRTDGPIQLLNVGRLTPQKRVDRFLRVVRLLCDRLPDHDIRATVVGEGPERRRLASLVGELGLDDVVSFRPASSDMPPVYRGADIFVLTSDFEGTPNVVMEAMASGLPVVSTDVGDVRELIPAPDAGTVVAHHEDRQLAEALVPLVEDPARRRAVGRRAAQLVAERRSLDSLADVLHRLYEHIGHPEGDSAQAARGARRPVDGPVESAAR